MIASPATLTIQGNAPILGTFGKSVPGGIAVNFGRSGGKHCDRGCPYHPESPQDRAKCYAAGCEEYRQSLAVKLDRHESSDPAELVKVARLEIALKQARARVPWIRISSFGSVPHNPPEGFRELMEDAIECDTPVHFPVESPQKASTYRKCLDGLPIAVRESTYTVRRFLRADGPASVVGGSMGSHSPKERVKVSKRIAAIRTKRTGRKCVVCPAVAAKHLRTGSKNAKCGACTACADPLIDIVYPAHK